MADLAPGRKILWEQLPPGPRQLLWGRGWGWGGKLRLTQEQLQGRTKMDPQDVPSRAQGSRLLLKKSAPNAYGCQGSCLGPQDPRAASSGFAPPGSLARGGSCAGGPASATIWLGCCQPDQRACGAAGNPGEDSAPGPHCHVWSPQGLFRGRQSDSCTGAGGQR